MTSVFNIALTGLNNAAARVANSASNIVNALSINHQPRDVISISNSVGNNNLGVSTLVIPSPQIGTPVSPPAASTPVTYGVIPTTTATLEANLPSSAPVGFTSSAVPVQIFDNLGASQTLSLTFTKTGINQYTANITVPNGNAPANFTASVPLTFNGTTNQGTLASIAAGTGYTVNGGKVRLSLSFPGAGPQDVTLNFGDLNRSGGVTQFADTNVTVIDFHQDGRAYGPLSSPLTPDSNQTFTGNNSVDIATELVNILVAKNLYAADATVIKTANKMQKALLDIET